MFNLLPGQGLGFTGAKLLAFGLGAMTTEIVPVISSRPAGGSGKKRQAVTVHDNAYSRKKDEKELTELLAIIFQVIE